ncbi:MAG: NusG domain II-containing protein [Oscillospiraceae bacterium]|nr:NusG domain II-containing protein [Oscillospiraceae bacterium]
MSFDRKVLRRDLLLILFFLLLSAAMFAFSHFRQQEGGWAVVTVNSKEVARYSLLQDGRYILNNGTNTLVIEDHTAWMEDALCPDQICVDMGKIRYSGQSIVCLPNRVVVSIEGVPGEADLYIG